jgi:hypothetical protein
MKSPSFSLDTGPQNFVDLMMKKPPHTPSCDLNPDYRVSRIWSYSLVIWTAVKCPECCILVPEYSCVFIATFRKNFMLPFPQSKSLQLSRLRQLSQPRKHSMNVLCVWCSCHNFRFGRLAQNGVQNFVPQHLDIKFCTSNAYAENTSLSQYIRATVIPNSVQKLAWVVRDEFTEFQARDDKNWQGETADPSRESNSLNRKVGPVHALKAYVVLQVESH